MLAARELAVAQLPTAHRERRRAQSRAPRPQAAKLSRTACFTLLVVAVLCAFMVAYRHTSLTQLGYKAEGLGAQLAVLQKENGEREVRVAQLGTLARVEQLAVTRVGMVRPSGSVAIASLSRSGGTLVAGDGTSTIAGDGAYGEDPAGGGLIGRVWSLIKRLARNTVEAARSGS